MPELHTPILIVGGGVGGVAAALAVAEAGGRCVVTEPTGWVGGQLTAQAVPPDENPWIEGRQGVQSVTRRYLDFRGRVRAWYRQHGQLTPAAAAEDRLNPGGGWVSHLCHAPSVGHTVLREVLAPHVEAGRIDLRLFHTPVSATRDGDRVTSLTFNTTGVGDERAVTITADVVLDATELGDVYPLARLPHRIGAEHRDHFGESHARADHADPTDQQAVSWCFAVEHRPGEDHTTAAPPGYDDWRDWVPPITDDPWPGPLFAWDVPGHEPGVPMRLPMVPWPDEPAAGQLELWRYRRIVNREAHTDPAAFPDVSLTNTVQMDYFRRPTLVGVGEPTEGNMFTDSRVDAEVFAEAKRQSLCFLHWLRVNAPRHDTDDLTGYPGLRLRGDELGTDDGFAMTPYIREPRRPVTLETLTESHVGAEQRLADGHAPAERPSAVLKGPTPAAHGFDDSVGIGHYRLDLHPSAAMRGSVYAPCCPFRVPLGALLLPDASNVVAAGKALGVTHVTNAATRLHPVEWAVGEAAGTLAALAVAQRRNPRGYHRDTAGTAELQQRLAVGGAPLRWPWDED